MSSNIDITQTIYKLKNNISVKWATFEGLWFFGSFANNKANSSSDIDVVLVFNKKPSWQEKNQILDSVADIEIENGVVIDAKIYEKNEFNEYTPFRAVVKGEGFFYGK